MSLEQSSNLPSSETEQTLSSIQSSTPNYLNQHNMSYYKNRYLELEELLEFAAETGQLDPPELALQVKNLKKVLFYTPPEALSLDELCQAEAELEKLYTVLGQLISPANILTLRTTSERYRIERPWWQALFLGSQSVGRNFFRQLFWVALLLVSLIFVKEYTTVSEITNPIGPLVQFLNAFLYGALGALVYLYKVLTELYTKRTLHPKKIATNWLRLFMGGLAGILMVNLFHPLLNNIDNTVSNSAVTLNAIGFLAGYSIEFFYQTLDKVIQTIVPKNRMEQVITPTTPRQVQIDILTKRLKEMTNEDDKAAIRRLLERI